MSASLRKHIAIFLLILFVFPFVERGAHDFRHSDDFHCTTKSAFHFHSLEHHCAICDFNHTTPYQAAYFYSEILEVTPQLTSFWFNEDFFVLTPDRSFSLRGPPSA